MIRKATLSLATASALLMATAGACNQADDLFCDRPGCDFSREEWALVASLANPGDPAPDRSNRFWNDPGAALLGQRFFFDARFSGPVGGRDALGRTVAVTVPAMRVPGLSCASCHDMVRGGADTASVPGHVSVGAGVTDVNAITVFNSAYHKLPSWSGKADSLWGLVAGVAEGATTMNGTRLQTAWVIAENYRDDYDRVFATTSQRFPFSPAGPEAMRFPKSGKPGAEAYDKMDPADQAAITRVLVNFAKAIEAYEYLLKSRDSDFDRWVKAGPRSLVLSPEARRGARLFVSKAGCIDCHSGPLLGDGVYRNIGVPQAGAAVPTVADCPAGAGCDCAAGKGCLPWGAYDGLKRLAAHKFRRDDKQWSDDPEDPTRKSLYLSNPPDTLKGTWRTPSLRDVALTAPYMHDGIYRSLDEVIWHYDSGGGPLANESVATTRAVQIKPLRLTESERSDLVAFLHTLNGRLPADLLKAPP